MKRAEGHLRRVIGMIEEERTCHDIAQQLHAVEKAIGIRPELPPHLADLYEREEFVTSLENDLLTVQDFIKNNSLAK